MNMADEGKFNVDKNKDFSKWYTEVLKRAELIDIRYPVKGFVVHRPNAAITEQVMFDIYAKELEKTGHKRAFFPSVLRKKDLQIEKDHVEGFDPEVFWIDYGGKTKLPERIGLKPTGEIIIYQM